MKSENTINSSLFQPFSAVFLLCSSLLAKTVFRSLFSAYLIVPLSLSLRYLCQFFTWISFFSQTWHLMIMINIHVWKNPPIVQNEFTFPIEWSMHWFLRIFSKLCKTHFMPRFFKRKSMEGVGQRKPVWFRIWSVGCSQSKRKQIKKIKNKKEYVMKEFQSIFFLVWGTLPLAPPAQYFMCRRLVRMKCYNSRALKCMLLFDVCLNYSTRWIISWNRCACAVHKMLGISHKILVDLALSRPGCECVVRVCLVLSSFNENLKTVMLYSCTHNHTNTHITQRHAAWVGFRQSVLRYFFSLRKLILDMYIWAIAYWRLHWLLKKELLCVCMREGCAVKTDFANLTETIRRN